MTHNFQKSFAEISVCRFDHHITRSYKRAGKCSFPNAYAENTGIRRSVVVNPKIHEVERGQRWNELLTECVTKTKR